MTQPTKNELNFVEQMGVGSGGSESQSSISSLKEGLHRVIGGSPPPPYEVYICDDAFQRLWILLES